MQHEQGGFFETAWERLPINEAVMMRLLRGTHYAWSRLFDGEHVFTVRPRGETPAPTDGGYRSLDAALRVKGMI